MRVNVLVDVRGCPYMRVCVTGREGGGLGVSVCTHVRGVYEWFVCVFTSRRVLVMCAYVCFAWEILMDVWNSAFPSSKTAADSTALYMLESGEMTEQTNWQTKQPSQVACVSGDLNWWGAWNTTFGLSTKDVTFYIPHIFQRLWRSFTIT